MAIPACLAILRYPLLSFDESVLQDVTVSVVSLFCWEWQPYHFAQDLGGFKN